MRICPLPSEISRVVTLAVPGVVRDWLVITWVESCGGESAVGDAPADIVAECTKQKAFKMVIIIRDTFGLSIIVFTPSGKPAVQVSHLCYSR